MSDRPTPETDAEERMAFSQEYMVPTETARKLERERDEAIARSKEKSKPTTAAKSPAGDGLGASPVRKSSVNLNDTVRFKITPTGWQYIGKVNATDPIYSHYPMRFKVDERGFSEAQLWSVMQFFGPAISLGGMPPIETEIYFPNDRTLATQPAPQMPEKHK